LISPDIVQVGCVCSNVNNDKGDVVVRDKFDDIVVVWKKICTCDNSGTLQLGESELAVCAKEDGGQAEMKAVFQAVQYSRIFGDVIRALSTAL
jgi:hypothetical protein